MGATAEGSTGDDHATTTVDRPRWKCALYGGIVGTISLPLFPASVATGGALAGYLREGETLEGVVVGAMAGLIPTIPFTVAALWYIDDIGWRIGIEPGGAFTGFDALYIAVLLLVFIPAVFAILSAVGGALGVHISEDL